MWTRFASITVHGLETESAPLHHAQAKNPGAYAAVLASEKNLPPKQASMSMLG